MVMADGDWDYWQARMAAAFLAGDFDNELRRIAGTDREWFWRCLAGWGGGRGGPVTRTILSAKSADRSVCVTTCLAIPRLVGR